MYDLIFIKAVLRSYYYREVAETSIIYLLTIFTISRSTLYEWISKYKTDLILEDNKNLINKRKYVRIFCSYRTIPDDCKKYIVDYIVKNKIFSIKKLRKELQEKFNVSISKGYVYKILKDNNVTHKQMQKNKYNKSLEVFEQQKSELKNKITKARRNIVSIDETGIELGLRPNRGWSEKNTRCPLKITNKRSKYSLIMGINKTKVIGYRLIKGSFNGEKFKSFITETILPKSNKASLLMDNARIHHYKLFKTQMTDLNKNLIFNVAYSPEFNPIEYVFNVLKTGIRNNDIDTYDMLVTYIEKFIKDMNKIGFKNYFEKSYTNLFS